MFIAIAVLKVHLEDEMAKKVPEFMLPVSVSRELLIKKLPIIEINAFFASIFIQFIAFFVKVVDSIDICPLSIFENSIKFPDISSKLSLKTQFSSETDSGEVEIDRKLPMWFRTFTFDRVKVGEDDSRDKEVPEFE